MVGWDTFYTCAMSITAEMAGMIDSRRDTPSGNVLEDTLEAMEVLPLHFKRNCKMIRELDVHSTKANREVLELQRSVLGRLRQQRKTPSQQVIVEEEQDLRKLARIQELYYELYSHSLEKQAVAQQSSSLLSRHLARLEDDCASLEAELRAKGALSEAAHCAPGDEVAARPNIQENLWLLSSVVRYVADGSDQYEVCDIENRTQRLLLPVQQCVNVPSTDEAASTSGRGISKGDRVIALYPDTTSFYFATVMSVPRGRGCAGALNVTVMVQFDDDHDETGVIPNRPCPAKYVLQLVETDDSWLDS